METTIKEEVKHLRVEGTDVYLHEYGDGNEFYGCDDNLKFDFSTLGGIINYVKILSEKKGIYSSAN